MDVMSLRARTGPEWSAGVTLASPPPRRVRVGSAKAQSPPECTGCRDADAYPYRGAACLRRNGAVFTSCSFFVMRCRGWSRPSRTRVGGAKAQAHPRHSRRGRPAPTWGRGEGRVGQAGVSSALRGPSGVQGAAAATPCTAKSAVGHAREDEGMRRRRYAIVAASQATRQTSFETTSNAHGARTLAEIVSSAAIRGQPQRRRRRVRSRPGGDGASSPSGRFDGQWWRTLGEACLWSGQGGEWVGVKGAPAGTS